MAQIIKNARLWLAEYNVSGIANAVSSESARAMQPATTIGSQSEFFVAGLKKFTLGATGFVAAALDSWAYTNLGVADKPFTLAPEDGGVAGEPCYLANMQVANYNVTHQEGETHQFDLSGSAEESLPGKIFHNASVSTSGTVTTTDIQLGAVPAGSSLFLAVHVVDLTGTAPTVDVVFESDDNGSFTSGTTQITVPQFSAVGSYWGSVAGAITDDYWRAQITVAGTTPTSEIIIAAGIA